MNTSLTRTFRNIIIPYTLGLTHESHHEATTTYSEAGLTAAFQEQDGKIQIESFLITGDEPVLEITEDNYFLPQDTLSTTEPGSK